MDNPSHQTMGDRLAYSLAVARHRNNHMSGRTSISEADRALIDAAIKAGKVKTCPPMKHSPKMEFLWDPLSNKIRSREAVEDARERDMVSGKKLPDVSAVRGLAAEGKTDKEISEILHTRKHWVVRVRRLNEIVSGRYVRKYMMQKEAKRLEGDGVSVAEIARILNTTKATVTQTLKDTLH